MPGAQFIRKNLDVQLPNQLISAYWPGYFQSIRTIESRCRLADFRNGSQ
jgi:hypothetical protein